MARWNILQSASVTENLAGGEAYRMSPELELTTIALTTFLKDEFYRSSDKTVARIRKLTKLVNPYFVSKLALYARNEFGMRSVSHLLACEVIESAQIVFLPEFISKVCRRVDDMTEIASCWFALYGKKLPKRLRKGIRKAFYKFDNYQLAKYKAERSQVKLVDLVNLCHPKPATKNKEALALLVKNQLSSDETWESLLTQAGQNAKDEDEKASLKKEVWKSLLLENKLPYFALLRNLNNIIEQAPECLDIACGQLTNEASIKKSLVLPFRFWSAYSKLVESPNSNTRKVLPTLTIACETSLKNIPQYDGQTLIALDVSGSMESHKEKSAMFAFALYKANPNSDLMFFAERAQYVSADVSLPILPLVQYQKFPGGGTNLPDVFLKASKAYDRIIILTDEQSWVGYNTPMANFNDYKKKYDCNPKVFHWDFAGLGTLQMPEREIYCMAGFSDKCFDIIKLLDQDKQALIKMIETYNERD